MWQRPQATPALLVLGRLCAPLHCLHCGRACAFKRPSLQVGHGTMWILTVHAILYYAYWGTTGSFRRSFAAWGGSGEVSNLAGSCAYLAGLVLWGSSLTRVRRHFYEVRHEL